MSWDQIHLCAESVLIHKSEMMNMILEPAIMVLGGSYKRGKVTKRKTNSSKRDKNMTSEQKENLLLAKFRQAGLPVTDR